MYHHKEHLCTPFIAGKTSKKPMILSATQNFSKLIHPFAVNREWFKGYDSRDTLKVEG